MDEFQSKYFLQQHAGRVQAAVDSSTAMVEFSKMSLRRTLLLNGAGIIPIVYSKVVALYPCAISFGVGALFSILGACSTYLAQWAIFCTWRPNLFENPFKIETVETAEGKVERVVLAENVADKAHFWGKIARCAAMLFVASSLAAFSVGLYQASEAIQKEQTLVTRQVTPLQNHNIQQ